MADDNARDKLVLGTSSDPNTPESENHEHAVDARLDDRTNKRDKIEDETDTDEAPSVSPEEREFGNQNSATSMVENVARTRYPFEAQLPFEEHNALWNPSVNQDKHQEFLEACFHNLQCSPYDIFASDTNIRAEPRQCRAIFSPPAAGLTTLTNVVICPLWAQLSLPHELLVLALQYASLLRRNDQRPWHYIYNIRGDRFINFMAQSLRSSETYSAKPLSARELVESTRDTMQDSRERLTIMGMVLRLLTLVFDDALKAERRTLPSPIEGRSPPEVYRSTHSDWRLLNQVVWRLCYICLE